MNDVRPLQSPPHLRLIEAAALAPSPDNNQPWRFASDAGRLHVYLDPADALPSDVNAMFDLVGVGATIENACIAARQLGYQTQMDLAPVSATGPAQGRRHVATLTFTPGADPDPLHPYLGTRCTNRKLYSRSPVEPEVLDRLAQAASGSPGCQIDWIADRPGIRAMARVVAAADGYRFQYESFHKEIFKQLRFSAEEAERTRDGLDIRTLELPPGTPLLLRWLRPWRRMEWLNRLRLDRPLTWPSILSVWRSGALGAISVAKPSPEGFVQGGRAFQRIWLAATREALALHPLGSLPVFLAHLEQLGGSRIHAAHQRLAARLGQRLRELVPAVEGRTLLMLFRLGRAAVPEVRSLRRPPEAAIVQPEIGRGERSRIE